LHHGAGNLKRLQVADHAGAIQKNRLEDSVPMRTQPR
jgi:hypothetical protein